MSYVYKRTEPRLWTVGFYASDGRWEPESDHASTEEAATRAAWLNGGAAVNALTGITRDRLISAVQHPAVTAVLEGLDSQGGTPADLAYALFEALRERPS